MSLAALFALLLASPAAAVERGPHVQAVGPTGATLMWRGPGATGVDLHGPQGRRHFAAPKPGPDGAARLVIDGLRPGVEWRYAVHTADGPQEGRFRTPPAPGAPFTFVAYGDSRTDHRAHAALAARIAAAEPDVVLHTGDLVTRGHRDHEWAAFFDAAEPIWRIAPLIPTLGNHDLADGGAAAFRAHFAVPDTFFAFTWGNARFIAVDSEVAAVDDGPDDRQWRWLLETVTAAEKDPAIDHIVAFVHKGPFSSHPARAGNTALRVRLPALAAAGLDLIVSGHDHFYERGRSDDGLAYLVLGGGGAPLYATVGPGQHDGYRAEVSRPIFSFARFRVRGRALDGCGVDLTGVPFDCFRLEAP